MINMPEVDVVSIMRDEAMAIPLSQGCACLQRLGKHVNDRRTLVGHTMFFKYEGNNAEHPCQHCDVSL